MDGLYCAFSVDFVGSRVAGERGTDTGISVIPGIVHLVKLLYFHYDLSVSDPLFPLTFGFTPTVFPQRAAGPM